MAEITVNKKTIKDCLHQGQKNKIIIPDCQREYSWTVEECDKLWEDILNFFESKDLEYFIGTIVTFKNQDDEFEIIDGQQRTTTLFLLLRAIYTKIEYSEQADGLKEAIKNYLWKKNQISGAIDFSSPNISSLSATGSHLVTFNEILVKGKTEDFSNNFGKNYDYFQKKIDDMAKDKPFEFFEFVLMILEKLILMPIEADNQESALTIFNTLNDRGLSLSDSVIFKSQIYRSLDNGERDSFIEDWKFLSEKVFKMSYIKNIDNLFYCYMMYLRAGDGDTDTTAPSMRKYYAYNIFERLKRENLFNQILELADFFEYIEQLNGEFEWQQEFEINKYVDVLRKFPNEWWKYPLCTFYLNHKNESDFRFTFQAFIVKFTRSLLSKFAENPVVNNIRGLTLDINKQIYNSTDFSRVQVAKKKM